MKKMMSIMAYTMVAGASMYGGYLLGSNQKKKRKTSSASSNNSNK